MELYYLTDLPIYKLISQPTDRSWADYSHQNQPFSRSNQFEWRRWRRTRAHRLGVPSLRRFWDLVKACGEWWWIAWQPVHGDNSMLSLFVWHQQFSWNLNWVLSEHSGWGFIETNWEQLDSIFSRLWWAPIRSSHLSSSRDVFCS